MLQLFKRNSFKQKSSKWFSYLSMPWKLVIYSQFFELNCVKFAVCPWKWENCQSCHLFILATSKSAGKNRWPSWPTHWTRVAMTTVWNGKKGEHKRFLGHFRVVPSLKVVPSFKAKLSAKPLIWRWVLFSTKLVFTRKVLHLTSFWKWEFLELVSGLFSLFLHEKKIHWTFLWYKFLWLKQIQNFDFR